MIARSLLSLALLGSCSFSACTSDEHGVPASEEDCIAVQEHVAKLRMAGVRVRSKLSESEIAKHKGNFMKMPQASTDACTERRDKGWAKCMLALESLESLSLCE